MGKCVIVNADDFGLSEHITDGILDCCEKKAVSSVSAVSVGGDFERGMKKLARFPEIGTGVHLCLNDETPLSPPARIKSLVSGGTFCRYNEFVKRLLLGRISRQEIYAEWKSQIGRFLASGRKPDHLNTHNHLHLFPIIFDLAVHLAEEYDIPAIRFFGAPRLLGFGLSLNNCAKLVLSSFHLNQRGRLVERGIAHTDATYGFYRYNGLSVKLLEKYINNCPPGGFTEIICHPGFNSKNSRYNSWNYDWEREKKALTDVFSGPISKESGLTLGTFGRLKTGLRRK
jgi:hypothetical protein